jgi:hypothetical protein
MERAREEQQLGYGKFARWAYRGRRPNWLAALLNRGWAVVHSLGVWPDYLVTLEVRGRHSGRVISLPLVMAECGEERYLVSMLGEGVAWVRNVRAARGRAVLRHGRREDVVLEEVAVERRAPVIKAYLRRAPGARPHVPVDENAPLAEFEKVAPGIPVFRVTAAS